MASRITASPPAKDRDPARVAHVGSPSLLKVAAVALVCFISGANAKWQPPKVVSCGPLNRSAVYKDAWACPDEEWTKKVLKQIPQPGHFPVTIAGPEGEIQTQAFVDISPEGCPKPVHFVKVTCLPTDS